MPTQFYGFSQTLSANMRNTLTELLHYKPNSAQAFLTVLFSLLATCTTSAGPAEEALLKYGEGLISLCRTGVSLTSPELSHQAQPLLSAANQRAHPTNTGNLHIHKLPLFKSISPSNACLKLWMFNGKMLWRRISLPVSFFLNSFPFKPSSLSLSTLPLWFFHFWFYILRI